MGDGARIRHWLGRRWVEGTYECAQFAAEVLWAEFAIAAPWPAPDAGVRAKDRQVEAFMASGQVAGVLWPEDGDIALMRDRRGRRLNGWHCGVMIANAVLHLPMDGTSLHQPLHRLLEDGWEIEGWYRCR